MKPVVQPATWALGLAAIAALALVHADPWRRSDAATAYVSSRSAATRLLPELPEGVPTDLRLRIARGGSETTRVESLGADVAPGLWVYADAELVGPADPDALDGLWGSLRAATSLRAAVAQTEAGLGEGGRIGIAYGDIRVELLIGRATPDGVGVYGALAGSDELWVIERELGDIAAQRAEAWVARRPWVADVREVVAIEQGEARLDRGLDGIWRARTPAGSAMLSTAAVEARLGRLLAARLDPWSDRSAARDRPPWTRIVTTDGGGASLWLAGACAGEPGRVVLDRGLGRTGCIDARIAEPWPLPVGDAAPMGWLEARLAPHAYGRVLAIEQLAPVRSRLRREGGGWVIERRSGDRDEITSVREPEVFRWYEALHEARIDRVRSGPLTAADVELRIETDATVALRLRCQAAGDELLCARDDEPGFAVRVPVELAFTADTFTDRQLAELAPGEARALEIYGAGAARQSAHLDLGVWRLDAPAHPEGDAALDDQRIEELLAAISGARAQAWVATPSGEPERTVGIERMASEGASDTVVVAIWDGCIARVDAGRAAQLDDATCRALAVDLLVDAPLERAIEDALALAWQGRGPAIRLRRVDGRLVREDGEALGELARSFAELSQLRAVRLAAGDPPGVATRELAVEPRAGEPYVLELGEGWARVRGQTWFYVLAPAEADDAAIPEPSEEIPGDDDDPTEPAGL
jgi:Domain of unknown function (DUF4340)